MRTSEPEQIHSAHLGAKNPNPTNPVTAGNAPLRLTADILGFFRLNALGT